MGLGVEHYDDCAPGGLNCPQREARNFVRSGTGRAIWPVCEAAPVGDGEIDLTFMRLPCHPAKPMQVDKVG